MSLWDALGDAAKFVGQAAPWIAKALPLPGPIGQIAATALGKVLGTDKTDPESLNAALAGATADQLLALKKADQDFQATMQGMGFKQITDLEKIAADDRASARAREIAIKDSTPKILAYGYGVGFFIVLGVILWMAVQGIKIDPTILSILSMLFGVIVGMVLGSKEYYFGSSAGSAKKDETIKSLSAG